MSPPRVSVVMPAHNAGPWIAEAVASVLGQTYPDLELLVLDDGSTDGTREVLAGIDDPRLRVVSRPHSGIVPTLNAGLELARGELLSRHDADDLMTPDRLARQVSYLDAHPGVVACGTDYVRFGAASGRTRMPRSAAACRARLLFGTCVAHGTAMMRADVIRREGVRYRPEYAYAEDYRFFTELSRHGRLVNLPFVGLYYRAHPGQISTARLAAQRAVALRVTRENLARLGVRGIGDDVLGRLMWADGSGPVAAVRHLLVAAPHLLALGCRAGGAPGLLTAAQLVREQLNTTLR